MPLKSDGGELRRRRELMGLTQVEFAERTGYTPNHVSQVELGNHNAGVRYLRAAAEIFDCTISDITDGEKPRRPRKTQPASAAAGSAA